MLREARHELAPLGEFFAWDVADIQSIPHPDHSFDVVIANHMLYHVPNRNLAIAEIRRVLEHGGTFYAASNGEEHTREIEDLRVARVPGTMRDDTARNFSLENGEVPLRQHVHQVGSLLYPDSSTSPNRSR